MSSRKLLLALYPLAAFACAPAMIAPDETPPAAAPDDPPADDDDGDLSPLTRAIAFQLGERDLRQHPPAVASMDLRPGTPEQRAAGLGLLEVRYAEPLPPQITFLQDEVVRVLADNGQAPDRVAGDGVYTGVVSIADDPLATGPVLPTAKGDFFSDPERSLMVRSTAVVDDPSRTLDACTSPDPGEAAGVWTFAHLLEGMANTKTTKKSSSEFATQWLKEWSARNKSVNKDPIPMDHFQSVPAEALRQWRCKSGYGACCVKPPVLAGGLYDETSQEAKDCEAQAFDSKTKQARPLLMNRAPFRLLAIVNRLDLRKNRFFGEGPSGELRFVFGVLDLDAREGSIDSDGVMRDAVGNEVGGMSELPCSPRDIDGVRDDSRPVMADGQSTVILEYAALQSDPKKWAQGWHDLSALTLDPTQEWEASEPYRVALAKITEAIVKPGARKGKPNDSALIRLRTNVSTDSDNWQMREFAIDNKSHFLRSATIKQTPAAHLAADARLGKWINDHEADLTRVPDRENLPATFPGTKTPLLGAQTTREKFGDHWEPPGVRNMEARHVFSRNTCNGCHGQEVPMTSLFAHVEPRHHGQESRLSPFLQGGEVVDPVTQQRRSFNDLFERNKEMAGVLAGIKLTSLAFQPTSRTH